MSGLGRCVLRRTAGMVVAVAAAGLAVAPAAWAFDNTITATATVQFSGPVDSPTSCTPTSRTTATIDWGDGTTPTSGTIDVSTKTVSGMHTYMASGTYSGTVTLVDTARSSCGTSTQDFFTADVAPAPPPPPMFTQCPAVGQNTGCQFLITVNNTTETVAEDPNQGPYEGAEDALIGVQNNSSSPIDQLPLAVPNSILFGFDQDGICDPGAAPIPSGCAPQPGAPAGTTCDSGQSGYCSFPVPAGEPAGYVEPGAPSGVRQNSYEGPTSWFSNVSADTSSGVVHFSPALQPGQSTYFGLEEPPTGSTIGVGGTTPFSPGLSPPTVTATGATFSTFVNPNGSPTTAYFQYGLDLRYSKLGGSGAQYDHSTPVQTIGADFANHLVTTTVSGLVPNALYHVRLVAQNGNGTTFGPDMIFTTSKAPAPGAPALGRTFNISPVRGLVLIKVHGVFIPLTQVRQIPRNTVINALHGTLKVITAAGGGHGASDAAAKGKKHKGKTQNGIFGGAIFKIKQAHSGLATLTLVESAFKGAPSFSQCKRGKSADASAAAASSRTLQLLRASAHGKFSTRGRYAAATVRGTRWTIADKCNGTLTRDITDSVAVTDFVRHKTIILHAGQRYLAKKP